MNLLTLLFQFGTGLLIVSSITASEEFRGCRAKPLEHVVPVFVVDSVSRADALARLAIEQRVCMGVELPASLDMGKPLSLSLTKRPMHEVMKLILSDGLSKIVVADVNSIVLIGHESAGLPWASVRIRSFKTTTAVPLQEASNLLRMELRLARDPTIRGFAGSYHSGDVYEVVGPFKEVNKTVGELLARLVRSTAKGGAWVGRREHPSNSYAPWTLVGYGADFGDAHSTLTRALRQTE